MSNRYLVSSSGMCLPTGVNYLEFLLLRSDMPDWYELAQALKKFVNLLKYDKVYNAEWKTITQHVQEFADIDAIYKKAEALIADFNEWKSLRDKAIGQYSRWEYLRTFPEQKTKLYDLEVRIFEYHEFFDRLTSFAKGIFLVRLGNDTKNLREALESLRESLIRLPVRKIERSMPARNGGIGAQV